MPSPETLRAVAARLYEKADRATSWERQEELTIRAIRLERRAARIEEAESSHDARIRLMEQLETETDPGTRLRIQSSLDNLN